MLRVVDQIGRPINLRIRPKRVVSLVPSLTELAYDLGFEVVGRTKFCIHPQELDSVSVVGGTKNVDTKIIEELKPDLILANKEENRSKTIQILEKQFPVYVSDISTLEESFSMITDLGKVGGYERKSKKLISEILTGFDRFEGNESVQSYIYLIWKNPIMAAGTDTFISNILSKLGLTNALQSLGQEGYRYPTMDIEKIKDLNPKYIFLSSEPYPFQNSDVVEFKNEMKIETILVDGEFFSWYGSRMAKALPYLDEFYRLLVQESDN